MLGLSELLSNQGLRLGDLLASRAGEMPEAPALRDDGSVLTHGALQFRIAEAAERLRAAGLGAGDRLVVIVDGNGAPALIHLLAALALEAVAVPVEPDRAAEIAAFCAPRLVLRPNGAIEPGPGGEPEETGLSAGRQPALIAFPPAGRPRGVVLSHRGLAWNAALVAQERHHGPGDLLLAAAPLTEPAVLVEVLGMLQAGGACRLSARLTAERLADTIARDGITTLLAPAELLGRLPDGTPNRLRKLALCGPPAPETLAARIEAALGLPPLPCHAAPESGPVVAFVRPGEPAAAGSVGRPLPGVELRVVDAEGQAVRPGQEGELLVRSAGVMLGYWRDPVATTAAFAAGRFLRTGCLAARDTEGHLSILGRLREAILRGGFSVHPAEIETLLDRQPGVQRAAVIGHHEDLLAFVEPRAGEPEPAPEALAAALARQLAPYKRPSRILVVSRLPLGPGGEIQRGTLLELLG
jgi:long-chain acyl-CoA synthetase